MYASPSKFNRSDEVKPQRGATRRSSSRTQQQRSNPTHHHQVRRHSSKASTSVSNNRKLEKPEVIFSNNHVLVVNKPAGWKSQPGDGGGGGNNTRSNNAIDPKCLLTYLQSQELGGGSLNNFLIPTHRLDQPCTGVLIFAKNGKAASRVQVAWAKRKVKKVYWVVVEGGANGIDFLISQSKLINSKGKKSVYQLSGMLKSSGGGPRGNRGGGSVMVKPLPTSQSSADGGDRTSSSSFRVCHIEWEHLMTLKQSTNGSMRYLLTVSTDTGAKHQVRALLALAGGTPIAGDLRYGGNFSNRSGGRVDAPLPDGSVALHARSVYLPTVSLGGMEFLKEEPFVANLPSRWKQFFGISEQDINGLR